MTQVRKNDLWDRRKMYLGVYVTEYNACVEAIRRN